MVHRMIRCDSGVAVPRAVHVRKNLANKKKGWQSLETAFMIFIDVCPDAFLSSVRSSKVPYTEKSARSTGTKSDIALCKR